MKTSEKIIAYIKLKKQVSVNELVGYLEISRMGTSKQLANLVAEGKIKKAGRPPVVFYMIRDEGKLPTQETIFDEQTKDLIDKNYFLITPSGERKEGLDGFAYWCQGNNLPLNKTAEEYRKTLKKYHAFYKGGLLDGMHKFKTTFGKVGLDAVFYLDFYSIERFGKTRMGQLLLYAKQSQNKKLIRELITDIRPRVDDMIKKYHVDAIGFIPPTVKREVQFMKELEKNLHPNVKRISIAKIKTEIIVPQKTLNKLKDRIENVQKTIVVNEPGNYGTILLIDDAVGSGATLNETATQIKRKGVAKKVIGLAITGSFKGFDVISEV
jgi:hypothetical protein